MKEQLLQLKQDIVDISNNLKTNLADKGVEASGTLSELVNSVSDIAGNNPLDDIGWNLAEQPFLNDAIEYAKEIQNNPKSTYQGDKQLVIYPKVEQANLTKDMFYNSSLVLLPQGIKFIGNDCTNAFRSTPIGLVDLSSSELSGKLDNMFDSSGIQKLIIGEEFGANITSWKSAFNGCKSLTYIDGSFDLSNCTTIYYMFENCEKLEYLDMSAGNTDNLIDCSDNIYQCSSLTTLKLSENFGHKSTKYQYGFAGLSKLNKIEGSISFKSLNSNVTYGFNGKVNYVLIKDIGTENSCNQLKISFTGWGTNTNEVPDARQSLIDSLITYSFDRANAGYSNLQLGLYKDVKALLTEDEIAQITAKGYTIV